MEGSHNVIISVDVNLLFISESDLAATVLGEEDSVSNGDHSGSEGAGFHGLAGADSEDFTVVKHNIGFLAENDTRLGLGNGFCLFDDDSVQERSEGFEGDHSVFNFIN